MFNLNGSLFVNDTYPSVWGLTYLFLKTQYKYSAVPARAVNHLDYHRTKNSNIPSIFD